MSDHDLKNQSEYENEFGSQVSLKQKSVDEKKHNLRWVLLVQILLFLTSGLILVSTGTVFIIQNRACNSVSYVSVYWPCVLTITSGVFVLALSCMDTLTLQSSRTRDIRAFAMILCTVILFQFAAIITSAVRISQLDVGGALYSDMLASMETYGTQGEPERVVECWDNLQIEKKCCGTNNFTDWTRFSDNQKLPSSCLCDLSDPFVDCTHTVNATVVYGNGCHRELANVTNYHLDVLLIVNSFMITLEVMASLVTLCTGCRIFRQSVVATYIVEA